MKFKQFITILLLVFVGVSVAYMLGKGAKSDNSAPSGESEDTAAADPAAPAYSQAELIVYYFHGDRRCPTCHKLENYAQEAMEIHFSKELTAGKIVWQSVNTDRAKNEHFINDYQLAGKAVVLSKQEDGQETAWANLDQIWQRVNDKADYIRYVHESIREFLEDSKS